MKLKIGNKRILTMILTNAILLSQSSCCNKIKNNDSIVYNNQDTNKIVKEIENTSIQPVSTFKKCNNTVYSKKQVNIKKKPKEGSRIVIKVDNFQKLKQVGKIDKWSLVKYKNNNNKIVKGYVKSKNLGRLGKTYIEVDISDQKMTYYKSGKKFLTTAVVTGKDSTPTVKGIFKVYSKNRNYTMIGEHHSYEYFSNYVLKFHGAYYIHDARRNAFGGEIYHSNGSHGCVNTPYEKVKKIYNNTKIGTRVLIHQ